MVILMKKYRKITNYMNTLDPDQIVSVITELKTIDYNKMTVCPHCHSEKVIKHGHDRKGNQRFMCAKCHKTFTPRTNSFMMHSHISDDQWKRFIECEQSHMTLHEEADHIKHSVTTCFSMRRKLYETIEQFYLATRR